MKKYGWQAIYLSFFSGDLYRDVAKHWKGVAYLYLLCISFALSAIAAIGIQLVVMNYIAKTVDPIVAKWPTLTVADGKISIDKPTPYVIETDNALIDFDMSDDPKMPDGKRGWLVTKSDVRASGVGSSGEDKQVFDAEAVGKAGTAPMVLDQPTMATIVNIMRCGAGVFVFVIRSLGLLLGGMLQSVFYALIGLAVASVMKVELSYGTLVRLATVALTPGIVLETLTLAIGQAIPFWGLLSIVIAVGYLIFAINANGKSEPPITAL